MEGKLGIVSEIEKQMQEVVGSYFCEWTQVVNASEVRKY
jgi:nitrite reductase (NAD(P)H)